MGLMLAEPGFHTRAFVEWEGYPRSVLIAAQRSGYFAPAPIWDDLRTFDARPFRGAFDIVLAGYPCQPFSAAGKRGGADDPRHLWPHVARIIRELGDGLEWVFLENVSGHASLGAEAVLRELRSLDFTPAVGLFSAEETGAAHERLRWFCVAHRAGRGRGIGGHEAQPGRGRYPDSGDKPMANTDGGNPGPERQFSGGQQRFQPQGGSVGGGTVANASFGRCAGSDEGQDQQPGRAEAERTGDPVADTCGAELEGQQPGQHHPRRWQEPDGYPALPGGTGLHPPGPGDHAAWAAILAASPDRAPSFARRDAVAAAVNFAATLDPITSQTLEPRLRGLSGTAQLGTLVEEAGAVVDQAEALASFCQLADGLAQRTRALRLLGNGVFPLAAAYAWRTLATAHGLGGVDMAGTDESHCADTGGFIRMKNSTGQAAE